MEAKLSLTIFFSTCFFSVCCQSFLINNEGVLPATKFSPIEVADYDKDGDVDLLIVGMGYDDQPVAKLYRNTGNLKFEDSNIVINALYYAVAVFGDFTGDGNTDFFITGKNDPDGSNVSFLYKNDANGTFTPMTLSHYTYTPPYRIEFTAVDYNNDGKLDIYSSSQQLYKGNGDGTFENVSLSSVGLTSTWKSDWKDYDNDGDEDLLAVEYIGSNYTAIIYNNDGSGNFSKRNINFPNVGDGHANFTDINKDGKDDIVLTGTISSNNVTLILQNRGNDEFETLQTITGTPHGKCVAGDFDNDGDIDLLTSGGKTPYSDNMSYSSQILENQNGTFEMRYIPVPGISSEAGSRVVWSDLDNDGISDLLLAGRNQSVRFLALFKGNLINSVYTLSPDEKSHLFPGKISLCDIDGDSDFDMFHSGSSNRILINNSNGLFTEGLKDPIGRADTLNITDHIWADFNNDGDFDLFIAGYSTAKKAFLYFYDNDGNGNFQVTPANIAIPKNEKNWDRYFFTAGDYDNDGDEDISISYYASFPDPDNINYAVTKFFENLGGYSFAARPEVINPRGSAYATIQHAITPIDYNNDGLLDLAWSVWVDDEGNYRLYRNTGNWNFIAEAFSTEALSFQEDVSLTKIDYNNDAKADLYLSSAKYLMKNNSPSFSKEITPIEALSSSANSWGDADNNGFPDLLINGRANDNRSSIYLNSNGDFSLSSSKIHGTAGSSVKWIDINNDNKLDLLVAGGEYINQSAPANSKPAAPTGLKVANSGSQMIFSWQAATDNETASAGLKYNVRIGNTPGGSEVLALSPVPGWGNAGGNLKYIIIDPPVGTYYFTVQAVDPGYLTSEFAAEMLYSNDVLSPEITDVSAPADFSEESGEGFKVSATITDQSAVEVTLYVKGEGTTFEAVASVPHDGGVHEFTINPQDFIADKIIVWYIEATDLAGNKHATAIQETLYKIDYPQIEITNTPAHSSSILVAATIVDKSAIAGAVLYFNEFENSFDASKQVEAVVDGDNYTFKISGESTSAIGIKYFIQATDSFGNTSYSDTVVIIHPNANILPLKITGGEKVADYQLISVPLTLSDQSIQSAFESVLGKYDPREWRMFSYANGANTEFKSGLSNIETGRGYWILSKKSGSIPLAAAAAKSHYQLALNKGWNLIGNPYPYPLNWGKVVDYNEASAVVESTLYFVNKGVVNSNGILPPYVGAFVMASEAITLEVPSEKDIVGRLASDNTERYEGEDWIMPFTVNAGDWTYQSGGVGMHHDAAEGSDRFDRRTLPRFIEYVDVFTDNSGSRLSRDVVPNTENAVWKFKIDHNLESDVILSWIAPQVETGLYLYIPESAELIDMKETSEYRFKGNNGSLTIVKGTPEFVAHNISLEKPLLSVIYPNPSSDVLNFPFFMPEDSPASIAIDFLDLTGSAVFGHTFSTNGGHNVTHTVQLKDTPVSSGIYIVKCVVSQNGKSALRYQKIKIR